ncbi:MAG: protein-disulfide reductase DsbD family protein, partial [Victivallales bacterium]|nr:protein-disulfide reductase DsbD family protein [Victivallales bacterium]
MRTVILIGVMFGALTVSAAFESPFKWQAAVKDHTLAVRVLIPAHHYLYEATVKIVVRDAAGQVLTPEQVPATLAHHDDDYGDTAIYPAPAAAWLYPLSAAVKRPLRVTIAFQGCRGATDHQPALCFMPQNLSLSVDADSSGGAAVPTPGKKTAAGTISETAHDDRAVLPEALSGFTVVRSAGGIMNAATFLRFISGEEEESLLGHHGWLVMVLLILLGGAGLNLTPCVLPMIPINLAIIGAGRAAVSRRSGLVRGGVYGLGMALAYGGLGLVTLLTGAQFGTL